MTLVFVAVMWYESPRSSEIPDTKQQSLADTALMYELGKGDVLSMDVLPGDRLYYLLTRVAGHKSESGLTELVYGIHCRFLDPSGHVVKEHDFYEHSRWDLDPDNPQKLWAIPADSDGILSSPRLTALRMDTILPKGGRVQISAITPRTILVKAYKVMQRQIVQKNRKMKTISVRQEQALTQKLGIDLDTLTPQQQQGLFKYRWLRVSMVTPKGLTPKAYRIYFRKHPPRTVKIRDKHLILDPSRVLAVNTMWQDLPNLRIVAPQENMPEVSILCMNHDNVSMDIPMIPDTKFRVDGYLVMPPYEQPDCTLYLKNTGQSSVRLYVVDTKKRRILNHRYKLFKFPFASDDRPPVHYTLTGFGKHDPVRIRVWAVLDGPVRKEKISRKINIRVIFKNGKTNAYRRVLNFQPSSADYFQAKGNDPTRVLLSLPVEFFMVPGQGAKYLEVTANQPSVISVYCLSPKHEGLPHTQTVHWFYKSPKAPRWVSMVPIQPKTFGYLLLQPRLVPVKPVSPPDKWASCPAMPGPALQTCFEPWGHASDQDIRKSGLWCGCPFGQPVEVSLPPDPINRDAGILTMVFNTMAPGQQTPVRVFSNGKVLANIHPLSRTGGIRIGNVMPATARLKVEGVSFALFKARSTNKNSCRGCMKMKAFVATRVPPNGSQTFYFSTSDEPQGLNIVSYSLGTEVCLSMVLDHGLPEHKKGPWDTFTFGSKDECASPLMPPKSVWIPMAGSTNIRQMNTIFFPLHNDLARTRHSITLYNRGKNTVWVRMFTRNYCGNKPESVRLYDVPFVEP